MPDTLSNIGYLDVQFGALDFGSEEAFDTISDKFQSSNIVDNSQNVATSDVATDYQSKSQGTNSLQQSQLISNSDALTGQTENLSTTGYSQRQNSSVVQTQTASANTLANASAGKRFYLLTFPQFNHIESLIFMCYFNFKKKSYYCWCHRCSARTINKV